MKKRVLIVVALSIVSASIPALAVDHSHGGDSGSRAQQGNAPKPQEDLTAKEAEALLSSCAQQASNLERRINRLQNEMAGKRAGALLRDELKKLEEKLKEANDIVRPIQFF